MGKDPAFGNGSSGIVINQFTYSSKIQVTCIAEEYHKPLFGIDN